MSANNDTISFITEETKYSDNHYSRDNTVKHYGESNKLTYPLLMLSCAEIELFRVDALRGMLRKNTFLDIQDGYNVYLNINGDIVGIGILSNKFLKSLLSNKVFNTFAKQIYLDKNTVFENDMLFALCTAEVMEA